MKPTENDINLVERYFDAELSAEELSHFNSRVERDEAFKALFHREKIIIGAIRNQGLLDNLQYLKSIEEKIQGNQSHPSGFGAKKELVLLCCSRGRSNVDSHHVFTSRSTKYR